MSRNRRNPEDYELDTVLRAVKVLQALEGRNFEPVNIKTVERRSGQSYAFCRSALLTFKKVGFAAQTAQGWTVGPKLMRLAANFNDVCVAAFSGPEESGSVSDVSETA
jgi:hypothetical protein